MNRALSIVIPVFNSRDILEKLLTHIEIERKNQGWDLELILIDDGSTDGSFARIKELKSSYPYIRAFRLSRNYGHQAAVRFGLERVTMQVVAIIDDDLQDPPSLLPQFFAKLDEGYDVVYGVRQQRKESFLKVFFYKSFYRVLNGLAEIHIPLDSGDFCLMRKIVVDAMLSLHERNPFLRGIRSWVGFRQIGLVYERKARAMGESGYTLKKLFKIASDGVFSFSFLPLRFITLSGAVGLIFGLSYLCYVLVRFYGHGIPIQGFTTLAVLIIIFSSINLISMGIVGEYVARIYSEGKNRPYAVLAESC